MNLSETITRVCDDSNITSGSTGVNSRITRHINRICGEIWDGYEWSFRSRNYRIVTSTDVTTGTVTATNGSRTITASGTPFLSTHIGWHIYFPGDSILNWYRVNIRASTSEVEIDVPYQGETGSGKSYVLRRFDYSIPTEIWDIKSVSDTSRQKPLSILQPSSIESIIPATLTNGSPESVSIYRSDVLPTTYSTGTLTGSIDSNSVTGSGTSWLDNVYPGDKLTIGSYVYTVYKVDTDTTMSLYNYQVIASSGATYTIKRQFNRILRILWTSDNNYVLDIRGLRKYAELVHSSDTNEILYRYPDTVIKKVAALELRGHNDRRAELLNREADGLIARAKAEDDSITPKINAIPIQTYRLPQSRREVFH